MEVKTKKCAHCKKEKFIEEFGLHKRNKDGRACSCKICTRLMAKVWLSKMNNTPNPAQKEKKCAYCKQALSVELFGLDKRHPDGYQSRCRPCCNKIKKKLNYQPDLSLKEKKCTRCSKLKEISNFNKHRRIKDGYDVWCKECRSKYKTSKKTKERRNKARKIRRQQDPNYKIKTTLRRRVLAAINNQSGYKAKSTVELLGCAIEHLREHLESQFQEGMSWENHGDWHIDHIRPCASFDLTDPGQQKECFHYSNLQPLWAKENLSKGAKEE